MKTIEMMALVMFAFVVGAQDKPVFPDRPAPEAVPTVAQIDEKIVDLQKQLELLEQKKSEAEHIAELQEQLTELHNESKDRIKDVDAQLANMETEEPPVTPAQHALCDGKRKYLTSIKSLSVRILGIKDSKALEQAQKMHEEIDIQETEWRVVDEPKLDTARTLEDLAKSLEQDNNQYRREMLVKLRQFAEQDAESRSQELAILSARREREKARDKLIQDFYKSP